MTFLPKTTHFLDNRWSDRLKILNAALNYHYLTLVQILCRYHFPTLRYKILGLIWAKRVMAWGRSVKYTHMTGDKKLTPRPKITPYRKSTCKIWTKIFTRKRVRGGSFWRFFPRTMTSSQVNDVTDDDKNFCEDVNLYFIISKESLKIFVQFDKQYLTTKLKVQFTQFHINDQTYSLYN